MSGDTALGSRESGWSGGRGSPGGEREQDSVLDRTGVAPMATPPYAVPRMNRYGRGGVDAGSLRHFVDCSYEYASLMRRDSSNARPKIVMPAGRVLFRV
jgi:hypothetical protein